MVKIRPVWTKFVPLVQGEGEGDGERDERDERDEFSLKVWTKFVPFEGEGERDERDEFSPKSSRLD